jgi:RHS repeat-associated protein
VIEETIAPAAGPVETAEAVWGADLSGTAQGAGGVGGLLLRESSANGASYYHYDGNGNVTALTSTTGTVQAAYTYGPFGETLRAAGPLAQANPWRFSTKYQDDETGLLYYGYRFYNPTDGRWPSRDPIEEDGGVNLYALVSNYPIGRIDVLGHAIWILDGSSSNPKDDAEDAAYVKAIADKNNVKRDAAKAEMGIIPENCKYVVRREDHGGNYSDVKVSKTQMDELLKRETIIYKQFDRTEKAKKLDWLQGEINGMLKSAIYSYDRVGVGLHGARLPAGSDKRNRTEVLLGNNTLWFEMDILPVYLNLQKEHGVKKFQFATCYVTDGGLAYVKVSWDIEPMKHTYDGATKTFTLFPATLSTIPAGK